jgi:adenylate cyclase
VRGFGKYYVIALAVVLLVAIPSTFQYAPVKLLHVDKFIDAFRLRVFDLYQTARPRPRRTMPVVIIDIDDPSMAAFGQWPWPRSLLAELTEKLDAAGARVVAFDILFSEPDRLSPATIAKSLRGADRDLRRRIEALPNNDEEFARALAGTRAVLAQVATNAIVSGSDDAAALKKKIGEFGGDPRTALPPYTGMIRSVPELEAAAKGLGVSTIKEEFDGIVRRIPTLYRVGSNVFPSIGLEVLRLATGFDVTARSDKAGITDIVVADVNIPTDEAGLTWIYFNHHSRSRFISAKDVLEGRVPPERIKNKIALIGSSAAGLYDIKPTPVGDAMPGVEIIAQWIETALAKHFLYRPNFIVGAEFVILTVICLFLFFTVPRAGAAISFLIGGISVSLLFGLSWYLFVSRGILLDFAYPAIYTFLLYIVFIFLKYLKEEAQRRQLRHAFNHYVSPDLVSQISSHPETLGLGGESRELTFLFTDIAGFTSLTERTEPAVLVHLLNEYLDGLCRIVMAHGGTIDKIVGDAIHAIFGAPGQLPDHAARAVACALEMDRFARDFEARKAEEGITFGATRIGINTGRAIVGNFGGEARFDYTAHGDAINLAARMESVNKHLGTRICVAGSTVAQTNGYKFRPVGSLVLVGSTVGLDAYEPVSDDEAASDAFASYEKAFDLLEKNDPGAKAAFEDIEQRYPGNPLVKFHLARFAKGETGARVVMAEK